MKRLLYFLLGRPRPLVVDVARFGPRLTWPEVQAAFRQQGGALLYRALGQVLACQRELTHRAVEDKTNLPHGQTAFEAGAAACTTDLLALLQALESGRCSDASLRAYFGEGERSGGEKA